MEDTALADDDEHFFDAFDEFPFYDCPESFESSPSPSDDSFSLPQSTLSVSSPAEVTLSGEKLRRRRSHRQLNRNLRNLENGTGDLGFDQPEKSTFGNAVVTSTNEDRKENEVESTVTSVERSEESTLERESDDGQFSMLVYLADLVIKAIGFQFNLLISFISFPFWTLYYGLMLLINPFYVIGLGRSYIIGKLMRLWKLVWGILNPYSSEWIKEHKSWLNIVFRFGWGLFWSVYVCTVLVSLLICAFVVSGLMMRYYVVEEPFQLKQALNFDYTKAKPEAFVPITNCWAVECGGKREGASVRSGLRVVPSNQKLRAIVTLVVPESDYNRNLGIFQIRIDFKSETGKSLASLSHPCMLQFKSEPLRLLLTFFRIIPLVAGYVSETQTLNLKFRGYTESVTPTACLKVVIEQRSEFRAGGGIPEMYDASLQLESELPFLKRILWYWRRTIYVWLSMMMFVAELLLALLCCRPLILPRARTRDNASRNSTTSNQQVQR